MLKVSFHLHFHNTYEDQIWTEVYMEKLAHPRLIRIGTGEIMLKSLDFQKTS